MAWDDPDASSSTMSMNGKAWTAWFPLPTPKNHKSKLTSLVSGDSCQPYASRDPSTGPHSEAATRPLQEAGYDMDQVLAVMGG